MTSPTPETLLDLLEGGRPGDIALQAPDGPSVTYDNLRRQVHDLGEQLRGLGIARDDRVLLALPNGIEAIVTFLAVSSVATAGPLNPGYRPEEFRFYMEDTHHKALITPVGGGEAARGVALEGVLQIGAECDSTGDRNAHHFAIGRSRLRRAPSAGQHRADPAHERDYEPT